MRALIAAQADVGAGGVLIRYGVPRDITPIAGLACVRSHGPFFEFDKDGTPAIIMPALEDGEPVDLLAFMPHRPHQIRVLLGSCPLLGIDNMGVWSEPLHLWRTPLGYLRASLRGAMVLSWPAAIPLLTCCSEIIAEDVGHSAEIRKHLTRPVALPKISVPINEVAA